MTTRTDDSESPLIESRDDLLATFAAGEKSPKDWTIGTEHEKFVYRTSDHRAPSYDEPGGIRDLLMGLTEFGWKPVIENGNVIALTGPYDGTISLEPAGQFELSGAMLENLHQTCVEAGRHLTQCKAVGERLGLGFLGLGMWPDKTRAELPTMPKGRYAIMLNYMPKVGNLGLDMMLRTCTIQTNLDYSSEADMVKKFRVGLALQPVATALFANSPFTEGKPNGYLSYRAHIWTDTDPDRTGLLDFVFEDGFGFERYARYALDVPMYFAKRNGRYVDLSGKSFRKFVEGGLDELPGQRATMKDWADHTTTIFPEVRLKQYLEMRGADSGPWSRICALPALWTGVFYDSAALAAAWDLCKDWTTEDRLKLREDVTRLGLKASVAGRSVQDVAKDLIAIARQGLKNRNRLDGGFADETGYLGEIEAIAESGITPAEHLLELYHGPWKGDVSRVFEALAY
jgi:glutamate--cysteine ligase